MEYQYAEALLTIDTSQAVINEDNTSDGKIVVKFYDNNARNLFAVVRCLEILSDNGSYTEDELQELIGDFSGSGAKPAEMVKLYQKVVDMALSKYNIKLPKNYRTIEAGYIEDYELNADEIYADALTSQLHDFYSEMQEAEYSGDEYEGTFIYDNETSRHVQEMARFILWSVPITEGDKAGEYAAWDSDRDGGAYTIVGFVETMLRKGQITYYAV